MRPNLNMSDNISPKNFFFRQGELFSTSTATEACDKYEVCLTLNLTTIKTIYLAEGAGGLTKVIHDQYFCMFPTFGQSKALLLF